MPLGDDEIAPVYSVLIGAVSKAGVCGNACKIGRTSTS